MAKKRLTIRDLSELIDVSVKSGTIDKDYQDFLKFCRGEKLSSYMLNLLIRESKEHQTSVKDDVVDPAFFVRIGNADVNEVKPETVVVVKEVRKKSVAAWCVASFLLICCLVEAVFMFKIADKNDLANARSGSLALSNVTLSNNLNELSDALNRIYDMTENDLVYASFQSWTSTNHEPNSTSNKSYTFSVSKGDVLSFDYFVSSEMYLDMLTVTLALDSDTVIDELLSRSGEERNSFLFTFKSGGSYNLDVQYSKDGSVSSYDDKAGVSNIKLHRNYESLLDSIHAISSINIDNIETTGDLR